jgi:tetratricopeptide (TPR) repeat protein
VAAGAPDLAAPRTGQAILEHAQGLDDRALHFLSEALRLDPVHVAALELLLEIDPAGERGARAAALLEAAAKHPQAPVQLPAWRGLLDLRRGRLEEAERNLLDALTATPDDPHVMLNLGTLYGSTGKLEQARALFQRLVARDPADGQAWFNLALTETRMELPEQAAQHLQKALGAGLLRPVVFNLLADLLHRRGETEAARELLRRSLAAAEDQPEVRQRLRELDSELSR